MIRSVALLAVVVGSGALASGCKARDITITGRVETARVRPDQFWPLVGGTVSIHDADGVFYASDDTDARGKFTTIGPPNQVVFATVAGEGLVTSSFTGVTGPPKSGPLVVAVEDDDSPLYGVLQSDLPQLRADFEGCPHAEDDGGIVFGEVRVIGITDPVTDEEPLVTTAEISVNSGSEEDITACYLDDAGVYDPLAIVTGDTGRFAIFGLEPGRWTLRVAYTAFVESPVENFSELLVPEDAVSVVPREPAWVEFPF